MSGTEKQFEFDEKVSERLDRLFNTEALKALRREYFQLFSAQPGERILDIGCGTAANSIALAKRLAGRCSILALDNSDSMLAIARNRIQQFTYQNSVHVQKMDAQRLDLPGDSFDSCMIIQVLEYAKDPIGMLREARRVLKPGGKVFVADTDWDTIVWNSSQKEKTRQIVELWSDHDADGWQGRKIPEYLKRAGFQNVKGRVFNIFEDRFDETNYSYIVTDLIASYLIQSGKMPEPEVRDWVEDLKSKNRAGHFYFSVSRFAFVGFKIS
jgi:ubiquinone/menaquinone biosynthesis C-methylase UbiE